MGRFKILFTLLVLGCLLISCAGNSVNSEFLRSYMKANNYYNQESYQLAIQQYELFLKEQPNTELKTVANYYIARSYFYLGNMKKAAQFYKKVIQLNEDPAWVSYAKDDLAKIEEARSTN